MVITGLETLLADDQHPLKQKKIGLIINHTSVDRDLNLGLDRFYKDGYKVTAIFAPEHGFRGYGKATHSIPHDRDRLTGIPIYSLYGDTRRPTMEMLSKVDVLVFDIQDIGVRFYTYIYTLAFCMEEAGKAEVEVYVLDRPNPINGVTLEGNVIDPIYHSFVGNYGLPIRHGMTVGELALYFNEVYQMGVDLTVVPMRGWKRDMWYDDTGLLWVMPSPNATGKAMTALYSGTCLFEGTNVSVGRGTTAPFELIGAPWINAYELFEKIRCFPYLDGVRPRPVAFEPTTSLYCGEVCHGVQLHITDYSKLQSVKIGLALLDIIQEMYPNTFRWLEPVKGEPYLIDMLCGTDEVRMSRKHRGLTLVEWLESKQKVDLGSFRLVRKRFLLY